MLGFFGGKDKAGPGAAGSERVLRHSSGWGQILQRLRGEESLRVLDIGPTSSGNINFITAMGHSIYLANLVEDAAKREWVIPGVDGEAARFDVERFLATHLDFSGRGFDVVLFWDVARGRKGGSKSLSPYRRERGGSTAHGGISAAQQLHEPAN
jgi:hypothetical protein